MVFPVPHIRLPHLPHLRPTEWRINDDDEQTVSFGAGFKGGGGTATLVLAPSSHRGEAYALKGLVGEVGVGLGPKAKTLKGAARALMRMLEKGSEKLERTGLTHYSSGFKMPAGTRGPLYYRVGRHEPITPATFRYSRWVFVSAGVTAGIVDGETGIICLLDRNWTQPRNPVLEAEAQAIGLAAQVFLHTVAWGWLSGLSWAPGIEVGASMKLIQVLQVEEAKEG